MVVSPEADDSKSECGDPLTVTLVTSPAPMSLTVFKVLELMSAYPLLTIVELMVLGSSPAT